MPSGNILILLHFHLPYVRHPEHERFLEETWLFEAMTDSYIPLLGVFERLIEDKIDFRVALSLSPTLMEMLDDPILRRRYLRHLESLISLAQSEVRRTGKDAVFGPLARMYLKRFKNTRDIFINRYSSDLVSAFAALGRTPNIELLTASATHAYLPNLSPSPDAVKAQLWLGMESFRQRFGARPKGIWLPECGYYEGLDAICGELGIGYFFLETHGVLFAKPRPRWGTSRPVRTTGGPVAFGRDAETTVAVWSRSHGYPGDPDYRDFYRDIGFDLPYECVRPHIRPYLSDDFTRIPTGIKYHRITGKTESKEPYNPEKALMRAKHHAGDFVWKKTIQIESIAPYGILPVITAPFDAELFGHWWHEGPEWLEEVLRGLSSSAGLRTVTPSECIADAGGFETVSPSYSSWGYGGYGITWAGGKTSWAISRVNEAWQRLSGLWEKFGNSGRTAIEDALSQACREALMSAASDWAFMIESGYSPSYAGARLKGHINAFDALADMMESGKIDERLVAKFRERCPAFGDPISYFKRRS